MRLKEFFAALLLAFGLTAQNASAQCVGFTDTLDDVFCPAVEWLKNRSITTGCGGTEFCPASAVSRLAMAQFMSRLGKALTPVVLHHEATSSNVTIASPAGGQLLCELPDYEVTGYPRTARFTAVVFGGSLAPSWIIGFWKYSTDAGVTWSNVPNSIHGRDWAGTGQVAGFTVLAHPMDLEVGTTYRFAVFGTGNSQTYTFNPFGCQLDVVITNRNGGTSPFDQ